MYKNMTRNNVSIRYDDIRKPLTQRSSSTDKEILT